MWDGVPRELLLCNFPLLSFVAMGTDAIRSAEELFLCNCACVGREDGGGKSMCRHSVHLNSFREHR